MYTPQKKTIAFLATCW